MRIVITGPTGAVGMALIHKCIEEKTEVLAICHTGSKRISNIPQSPFVRIIEADLAGIQEVSRNITENYDTFYHFAWAGTTGEARNDMQLQCSNIRYTLDAVELAHNLGCKTFIGAGSQAEYGRVEGLLTPQTPAFPENGYGMAKLCAGEMSRVICEMYGMRHIWVRILSVYGPYDGPNSMISATIKKLLTGEHSSFTPGEQMWDYLYSEDAAEAFYLLALHGIGGKIYVLGGGKVRPLKEYILEMQAAVQNALQNKQHRTDISCSVGSIGLGDYSYADKQVMFLGADISELTKDTGFVPAVSFEEGIRRVLNAEEV